MPVVPSATYATAYPARGAVVDPDADLGFGFSAGLTTRDGTPARVAGILLLSAGVLAALKIAGWRFNVAVSS